MPDMVNHPPHYETNGIECIDAMRASQGDDVVRDFCVCNAFKYIWRNSHKGTSVQDLEKAVWYLNKAIEIAKSKDKNEPSAYRCRACGLVVSTSSSPLNKILLDHLMIDHQKVPAIGYPEEDLISNWYEEIYEKENQQ